MSLQTWFPEPTIIKTAGGEIAITPITLGRVSALAKAIAPFVAVIPKDDAPQSWISLTADHGEAVIDAMSIATGQPRAELEKLPLDQAAQIAAACVLVNIDFFARRVLPAITAAAQQAKISATTGTA